MDSHPVQGHNIPAIDLPSTHRLPTVSAADALEELANDQTHFVSTGLTALDQALNKLADSAIDGPSRAGGLQKGQVTEVWGPPGSGKTSFGLQLAKNALKEGGQVVWVDAFRPVYGTRLPDLLDNDDGSSPTSEVGTPLKPEWAESLLHFTCPSLAHFVALLCRPTPACIPQGVSLIIIDSLSALVNYHFPKSHELRNGTKGARTQVLQSIISSLQKLAATRGIVLVILSQCATRMQAEHGATLIPAINAGIWDQGIATRLVLFRDWVFDDDKAVSARYVAIQKSNGRLYQGGIGQVYAFKIHNSRLVSIEHIGSQASLTLSSTPHQKRKLGDTDFEVADSEDDEYGWEDEDALPTMPPQWQGSEDLLVGQHDEEGNRADEAASEEEFARNVDPESNPDDDAESD